MIIDGLSPPPRRRCLRRADKVHAVPVRPVVTLPRGPNDSPDHTDTSGDCHEQPVARVDRQRPPALLQVGYEQHVGPVRGAAAGDVQGRSVAPTRAASACLNAHEVRRGRQHAKSVIESRPRAALAFLAPPQRRVCQCRRASSCSASIWKRFECQRPRTLCAGVAVHVPCRSSPRRTHE